MPMSLIPTFAVLEPMNQSLNVVTLLALSLTIGILVDDAIVEIENIVRHMRDGQGALSGGSMEAADEIGLAVVATTATIIAVFAPVGFMPASSASSSRPSPWRPASRWPSRWSSRGR